MISIPQWSDFNFVLIINNKTFQIISIPQWSDFNFIEDIQKNEIRIISIPQWSDFNLQTTLSMVLHKINFNPTMV